MLKHHKVVLGFLLATALWAVVTVLNSDTSAYYQICKTNEYTSQESCSPHHVPYVVIWYIGYWFDKASTVITAFATVAVAVFTWTLWQSSEKMWRVTRISTLAARQSARAAIRQAKIAEDALIKLERPYVFIFGVKSILHNKDAGEFFVTYTVSNFGKLPAIISGAWIDWVISEKAEPPIPPLLHDGHNLLAAPILEAGEKRGPFRGYMPVGMSTGTIIAQIDDATEEKVKGFIPEFAIEDGFDVFFRAVIKYDGPFSNGHETGACWLYMPGSSEFAVRGGDEYNYVR
jgi:hypothetical protein